MAHNASYFFVELNIRRIESDKRAGISKLFYQTKSPVMVVKICKRIPWGKTQHILRIVRRSDPPQNPHRGLIGILLMNLPLVLIKKTLF